MEEIFQRIVAVRSSLLALVGVQLEVLRLPRSTLANIEPSQVGTVIGSIMDACIPDLAKILPDQEKLAKVGLRKHPGILGDREGYPDYLHESGARLELKLLYIDPVDLVMKKPPTRREPSARITQKVTVRNVEPDRDLLLVIAYQLKPCPADPDLFSPTIVDFELFPMVECVRARDHRLLAGGGKWFGDY